MTDWISQKKDGNVKQISNWGISVVSTHARKVNGKEWLNLSHQNSIWTFCNFSWNFKIVEIDERRKFHKKWKYEITQKRYVLEKLSTFKGKLIKSKCIHGSLISRRKAFLKNSQFLAKNTRFRDEMRIFSVGNNLFR